MWPLSRFCQLAGCLGYLEGGELGTVPPDLVLALRSAFERSCVDECWTGAEAGLLRASRWAGGLVAPGLQAVVGRGSLRIRRRRLGERAAAGARS